MGAGRKRQFDRDEALSTAMDVFWEKGFNGASLSDLTEAMAINKPSLYAAFGNKEQLYVCALERYVELYGAPHFELLTESRESLQQRLANYLKAIVRSISDSSLPKGCLITTGTCAVGSSSFPEDATAAILNMNRLSTSRFIGFFDDEKRRGTMGQDLCSQVLADHLLSLQFGLAVSARNGLPEESLAKVIDHAVSAF